MIRVRCLWLASAIVLFTLLRAGEIAVAQVAAVPPLMNFQGRLAKPDGTPVADGTYSVRFSLWTALSAGSETWNQTINPVTVRNGTFAVLLSGFAANAFDGNRWLEIKIGTNAPLAPRQPLVTVAYAFKANTVPDSAITTAKIANGAVTGTQIASGAITADKFAANIFNPIAWLLGGNSGVTSGFLGTTDNSPLVFKVNNRQAMRYTYAENTATAGSEFRSINVLGGSEINSITAGVIGATIAGGGKDNFTGTDFPNKVTADFGTVGGGDYNTAGGQYATVAGGDRNTAIGNLSTIGGGSLNLASDASATVAGGSGNTAGPGGTVGGGGLNTANSLFTTVAGGYFNQANFDYATVGGGFHNIASGNAATIAGGDHNTASGNYATVGGGSLNTAAGVFSFAAGKGASANHVSTFVWSDGATFASTGDNQFLINAAGGMGINTNNPAGFALNVAGTAQITGFKLPTGAAASSVLASDATGNGTWQSLNTLIGPNSITSNQIHDLAWNKLSGTPLAWMLSGNSGTNPASQFLGTTDNQPLVFKVNNRRAMQYQYAERTNAYRSINVLGGSELNSIAAGVVGATIAGGGRDSITDTNYPNSVTADFGTVGGGMGNTVSFAHATVGGGLSNTASGPSATVAGGQSSTASGASAAVGGGHDNTASGNDSTVGGGHGNTVSAGSATVPGGDSNTAAGNFSFAAGRRAKANHHGAFVWGDSTDADFASTGVNQFLVRAARGVGINTNAPNRDLTIAGFGGTYLNLRDSGNFEALLGADAGGGVLATMTNHPLELRLNNSRALRLEPARYVYNGSGYFYDGPNVIAGYYGNQIVPGVVGSTIAGGGYNNYTGATQGPSAFNKITARASFIGGGADNHVGFDGAAQDLNNAFGTIGGGSGNRVEQPYAVIGGGSGNLATEVVSGELPKFGGYSVIGGGDSNLVKDFYATVPGGRRNAATGAYSFAAGYRAKSQNTGTFVWADSQEADFISGNDNAFLIRASGGVGINATSAAGNQLAVVADASRTITQTWFAPSKGSNQSHAQFGTNGDWYLRSSTNVGNVVLQDLGGNVGVGTAAPAFKLDVNGSLRCFSFTNSSDARLKTEIAEIANPLDAILSLHGVTYCWNRNLTPADLPTARQIGFLAQEVEKVLPELVSTDAKGYKSVAYVNVVPVLVEAVKALKRDNDAMKAANHRKEERITGLEAKVDALVRVVEQLKAARK